MCNSSSNIVVVVEVVVVVVVVVVAVLVWYRGHTINNNMAFFCGGVFSQSETFTEVRRKLFYFES
tara:strand:+ start:62 stop:256 length:195 start_codon:yes stop_codon:yes gene_type:complete